MAARRERARQRTPKERRYTFTPGGAGVPAAEEVGTENGTQPDAAGARAAVPQRGFQPRHAPRTFAEYGAEYAYVVHDLRRIVLVVGTIVLVLLVLWFILPH
jgi:hypothetical protein